MSEGLVPSKGSEAREDSQPGAEDIAILPKTVNPDDRKTMKQRRKELVRRKEVCEPCDYDLIFCFCREKVFRQTTVYPYT